MNIVDINLRRTFGFLKTNDSGWKSIQIRTPQKTVGAGLRSSGKDDSGFGIGDMLSLGSL